MLNLHLRNIFIPVSKTCNLTQGNQLLHQSSTISSDSPCKCKPAIMFYKVCNCVQVQSIDQEVLSLIYS